MAIYYIYKSNGNEINSSYNSYNRDRISNREYETNKKLCHYYVILGTVKQLGTKIFLINNFNHGVCII